MSGTLVGSAAVRGVSGGERKRVNIGVELIKNPSALFLDEVHDGAMFSKLSVEVFNALHFLKPTSGLDSYQALSVISCMASLAASGRTVNRPQ